MPFRSSLLPCLFKQERIKRSSSGQKGAETGSDDNKPLLGNGSNHPQEDILHALLQYEDHMFTREEVPNPTPNPNPDTGPDIGPDPDPDLDPDPNPGSSGT